MVQLQLPRRQTPLANSEGAALANEDADAPATEAPAKRFGGLRGKKLLQKGIQQIMEGKKDAVYHALDGFAEGSATFEVADPLAKAGGSE